MPLIILWAAASLILLGDAWVWPRHRDLNVLVAIVGFLAALSVVVQRMGLGITTAFGKMLSVDPLGDTATVALLLTGFLAALLAWTYLKNRGIDHGEYYALLLFSVSGAVLMASAGDLIVVFLGLEVMSFGLYVLAGFARTEARSQEASLKYFLLGAFASAFLLYGIALVYGGTQSTDLEQVRAVLSRTAGHPPMILAGVALILVGLGFKAALVPFHQWTPDVYEGAPTSATAFMAVAAKIGAFVAILRVFDSLVALQGSWLPAVQALAVLSMVFGNLLAVAQTNVKRMLAYSSIAHAGYLLVAVAAAAHGASGFSGSEARSLAMNGAMFYLYAYAFMTLGAFGVLVYLTGRGRDIQRIEDLRGLARRDGLAAYGMLFFMLSLGGIPPTMGFMGKWMIFNAALHAGEVALAVVMALTSVIAVYYYLRIVWVMCFEEPVGEPLAEPISRAGAWASVMVSAVATLLFGVVPGLFTSLLAGVR